MTTISYSTTLTKISCGVCYIPFAIPSSMQQSRAEDGARFYCPNGHSISYHDDENTRLKQRLAKQEQATARERARRDQAEAEARHQEARANGYKGAATKIKKRVAKGVCPAPGCKRSFVDVARHVATCHPELGDAEVKADGRVG